MHSAPTVPLILSSRTGRDIWPGHWYHEGIASLPARRLILIAPVQVSSDEEAVKLMNDSPYGLTASVWTDAESNADSEAAFLKIADELVTGTVYLNRCAPRVMGVSIGYADRRYVGVITSTRRSRGRA